MKQYPLVPYMQEIMISQSDFLSSKSMEERKSLGQFFTSSVVSNYMSSLINKPKSKTVKILDAGAGTGILTASAALRCLELGCNNVHAVLYELDNAAIPHLEKTLKLVENIYNQELSTFSFEIHNENFVLARPDKDTSSQNFDISIINPPYFKYIVTSSPYAKAAADLYHGDPNIYASFMAIVMSCLKDNGQMISITPRSFTNGLYFKGFRNFLLRESALDLIHIFKRRDKIFKNKESSVLQENIICKFIKGQSTKTVKIRSSESDAEINNTDEEKYPLELIIDSSNDQSIIRIPESAKDANFLYQAETLPTTFERAGYFISTGRVVEHRTRTYITEETTIPESVPLYRPHNVTPIIASWTGSHKKDVSFLLNNEHEKHTVKNDTYVLLKRFSSKDEKRRLVAGVYLKNTHPCGLIGFGNKTNYIGLKEENLSDVEAFGLSAIFNSSFMDKYFRCISGNTQVNATEIRVMKFPTRDQVITIGKEAEKMEDAQTSTIDIIVNKVLETMNTY